MQSSGVCRDGRQRGSSGELGPPLPWVTRRVKGAELGQHRGRCCWDSGYRLGVGEWEG